MAVVAAVVLAMATGGKDIVEDEEGVDSDDDEDEEDEEDDRSEDDEDDRGEERAYVEGGDFPPLPVCTPRLSRFFEGSLRAVSGMVVVVVVV